MNKEGLSKRQVKKKYSCNRNLIENWLGEGVIKYLDPDKTQPKVDVETLENLNEGEHYILCRECGAYQGQITSKHLRSCCDKTLEEYKSCYDSSVMCDLVKENKEKSAEEREHQSKKMLEHFRSPEGEITRQKISEASKRMMDQGYREEATKHLREYNQRPEVKEARRKETKERWEEGSLREKVEGWHDENKTLSNELATKARRHISHKFSSLHQSFKEALNESGLEDFETEYEVDYYSIDEAYPDIKLAIEVDGCYFHSCPECGHDGPEETLQYDRRKETYLKERGWIILRFWGHEIKNGLESCIESVKQTIEERIKNV